MCLPRSLSAGGAGGLCRKNGKLVSRLTQIVVASRGGYSSSTRYLVSRSRRLYLLLTITAHATEYPYPCGALQTKPQVIEKKGRNGQPLYSLDRPLTDEGLSDLIDRTVDRLLEVDSPSLETMKMQVAFDSSYITEEEDLVNYYQRRNTRLRETQRSIATMRPKDGADFDALTALHRQVGFVRWLYHGNSQCIWFVEGSGARDVLV